MVFISSSKWKCGPQDQLDVLSKDNIHLTSILFQLKLRLSVLKDSASFLDSS